MQDLLLDRGGDLSFAATGDLAVADVPLVGRQRVLRRLLTNTGDDIFNLGYGAGLAQFIGSPANGLQIRAVIRSQIFAEAAVAATPEPRIAVTAQQTGAVFVQIAYTDAGAGSPQALSFTLAE